MYLLPYSKFRTVGQIVWKLKPINFRKDKKISQADKHEILSMKCDNSELQWGNLPYETFPIEKKPWKLEHPFKTSAWIYTKYIYKNKLNNPFVLSRLKVDCLLTFLNGVWLIITTRAEKKRLLGHSLFLSLEAAVMLSR